MGNILRRHMYNFTTGTLGSAIDTKSWYYGGNSTFGKRCYGISGIDDYSFDALGNPTYNQGTCEEFQWNGRELTSYDTGHDEYYYYSYNSDGIRTKKVKSVYGELTTTYYVVEGTKILSEIRDDGLELYYFYDENDAPVGLSYNGTTYYYYKNIFGDIIGIFDASGYLVVRYAYDAWGNLISKTGAMASTLGNANPFRYRGYYYDTESGLYYLNARYYNPEWGRFISIDPVLDTGSAVGCNLFTYCGNDPVNRVDPTGGFWISIGALIASVVAVVVAVVAVAVVANVCTSYVADSYTTNEAESAIAKQHPIDAVQAYQAANIADEYVKNIFGRHEEDGNQANAFRHMMWNAVMTDKIGESQAKAFGDAHEQYPQNPEEHKNMDLYNNALGRQIAITYAGQGYDVFAQKIIEAIKNREAVVIIWDQNISLD